MLSGLYHQITSGLLLVLFICLLGTSASAKTDDTTPTQYLAFQVFTGSPSPNNALGDSGTQQLSPPPSKAAIKQVVQNIIDQIGVPEMNTINWLLSLVH